MVSIDSILHSFSYDNWSKFRFAAVGNRFLMNHRDSMQDVLILGRENALGDRFLKTDVLTITRKRPIEKTEKEDQCQQKKYVKQ